MNPRFLIVGAGFSGAVAAREIVERIPGSHCDVVDQRDHVAGNCHSERDAATGVMVHVHGPHIFNTNHEDVWAYVRRFCDMRPYVNRVKASTDRGVFSLPINLHTINQFFGRAFNPAEAEAFVRTLGDASIEEPVSFEDQALKFLGEDLYRTFFYGYTKKQWGCEPRELPASILKRLPVRFNYNDSYYATRYQGIPAEGFTAIIERILDHPAITVRLATRYTRETSAGYAHTIYTGPIDEFFGYSEGRLAYRTITFERIEAEGDYQGNAVINYPGSDIPYTRIHEHKHFAPWESHARTVAFREYSKETEPADTPYYPKRLGDDLVRLEKYQARANHTPNVTFLGRLATYRYLDMDQVIGEALDLAEGIVQSHSEGTSPLVFGPVRSK